MLDLGDIREYREGGDIRHTAPRATCPLCQARIAAGLCTQDGRPLGQVCNGVVFEPDEQGKMMAYHDKIGLQPVIRRRAVGR